MVKQRPDRTDQRFPDRSAHHPREGSDERRGPEWTIVVVRSGGFAGLHREWCVSSVDDDRIDWAALVEACPWNSRAPRAMGADQFVWSITAAGPDKRTATLGDPALTGPWRELVTTVQSVYKQARPRG
jgi:hypothetical protein